MLQECGDAFPTLSRLQLTPRRPCTTTTRPIQGQYCGWGMGEG